ncbi:MAG: MBG domain-containing protein, partial [Firmicutes bacterium]|nr:MBG domain-containing protein [Bacillota bacterium]
FDCSLTTVKDAGNYVSKVTLKGDCTDLYVLTNTATKSFTINPYTATLNWSASSFVYNGEKQAPTAKFVGVEGDGELIASVSTNADSKNAGNYTAYAKTDNQNYELNNENLAYEIKPKKLSYEWGETSFTYDGNTHVPTVVLSDFIAGDNVAAIVKGEQTNAKNGYTATIIGVDNSNYTISGQPSVSFDIAPLEKAAVWKNLSFVYDKTAKLPKAYYENVFGAKITLKVEASGDNVNAGSFSATASEITTDENYTLTNLSQDAIEIAKKSLTLSWSNVNLTFNGEEQKPTATLNGVISGDVVSVTMAINEGKSVNAGNYTAVASITSDNYSLMAASKEYVISKKNVTAVWKNLSAEYNGAEQKPTAHYVDVKGDNIELAVTASGDCINVGEYSVEAALADTNYELSGSNNTLTISPAVIAISWTGGGETHSFEFSGAVPSIVSEGLSATISSGVIGSDVVDIIVSMSDNYNVGSYTATAMIKGEQPNYVISSDCKTCNYTITPVIVDIIWGNTSFVYDGLNHRPEKPHYNDIGGNAVELNVIGDLAQNVGEYEVTAGDITNENYVANEATKKRSFSIVPASGTVSWTIAKTYYYDHGNEIDVVLGATFECLTTKPYATTLSSSNPSDGLTIEILGGAVINAGSYTAKVTLSNGNFKISSGETFTFEVKALPVALGYTVGAVSKTIDEIKADGLTKAEASELRASYVYGDNVNLSASIKFIDAGGAEVAASDLQVGNTYKIEVASLSNDNYIANAASTNIEFTVKE